MTQLEAVADVLARADYGKSLDELSPLLRRLCLRTARAAIRAMGKNEDTRREVIVWKKALGMVEWGTPAHHVMLLGDERLQVLTDRVIMQCHVGYDLSRTMRGCIDAARKERANGR